MSVRSLSAIAAPVTDRLAAVLEAGLKELGPVVKIGAPSDNRNQDTSKPRRRIPEFSFGPTRRRTLPPPPPPLPPPTHPATTVQEQLDELRRLNRAKQNQIDALDSTRETLVEANRVLKEENERQERALEAIAAGPDMSPEGVTDGGGTVADEDEKLEWLEEAQELVDRLDLDVEQSRIYVEQLVRNIDILIANLGELEDQQAAIVATLKAEQGQKLVAQAELADVVSRLKECTNQRREDGRARVQAEVQRSIALEEQHRLQHNIDRWVESRERIADERREETAILAERERRIAELEATLKEVKEERHRLRHNAEVWQRTNEEIFRERQVERRRIEELEKELEAL